MSKKYDSKKSIQTILTVSTKLFLEKGFDKTSMQDIATSANMSKGAIYHHFKSKEEIINKVMELQSKSVEENLDSWIKGMKNISSKEKLINILEKNLADQQAHSLDDILSTRTKSPEFVVSYMHSCISKSAPVFSQIIQEGNNDGSIKTDYPDECAEVFFLLIIIWCDSSIFECSAEKLEKRLKFLQSMMKMMEVDIVSNELILKTKELLQNLYYKNGEKNEQ